MDYRGHFGTILPEAQALAGAAHLREIWRSTTGGGISWNGDREKSFFPERNVWRGL